jgi:hypothetical protein
MTTKTALREDRIAVAAERWRLEEAHRLRVIQRKQMRQAKHERRVIWIQPVAGTRNGYEIMTMGG